MVTDFWKNPEGKCVRTKTDAKRYIEELIISELEYGYATGLVYQG